MTSKKTYIRKPISTRKRFEIFKRDSFTCQYCGVKPPKTPLEVDHIIPVSKGGTNDEHNLITACFDCNRGKSNIIADVNLSQIDVIMEKKRIAVLQNKKYQKILNDEKKQIESEINLIDEIFSDNFEGHCFTDKFKLSIKKFIKTLGIVEVEEAMEKACSVINNPNQVARYFCGICWNKIKGS